MENGAPDTAAARAAARRERLLKRGAERLAQITAARGDVDSDEGPAQVFEGEAESAPTTATEQVVAPQLRQRVPRAVEESERRETGTTAATEPARGKHGTLSTKLGSASAELATDVASDEPQAAAGPGAAEPEDLSAIAGATKVRLAAECTAVVRVGVAAVHALLVCRSHVGREAGAGSTAGSSALLLQLAGSVLMILLATALMQAFPAVLIRYHRQQDAQDRQAGMLSRAARMLGLQKHIDVMHCIRYLWDDVAVLWVVSGICMAYWPVADES